MASCNAMSKEAKDILTECPVCTETMYHPKILPCVHTFCLDCLEEYGKHKKAGEKMHCPVCRRSFQVPLGGLINLPNNVLRAMLLDANSERPSKHIKTKKVRSGLVSPCKREGRTSERPIKKVKMAGIVCKEERQESTSYPNETSKKLKTSAEEDYCELHPKEEVRVYCLECKIAVCTSCFILEHNKHSCADLKEVSEELEQKIQNHIAELDSLILNVDEKELNVRMEREAFMRSVDRTESKIKKKGKEIKRLVDEHVETLLVELNSKKIARLKELEDLEEELKNKKKGIDSLKRYSHDLIDNGFPSEIARKVKDIKTRMNKLKNQSVAEVKEETLATLVPSELSTRNMIGNVFVCRSSQLNRTMTFKEFIHGKTSYRKNNIFIAFKNSIEIMPYPEQCGQSITFERKSEKCEVSATEGGGSKISEKENTTLNYNNWSIKGNWLHISFSNLGHGYIEFL